MPRKLIICATKFVRIHFLFTECYFVLYMKNIYYNIPHVRNFDWNLSNIGKVID